MDKNALLVCLVKKGYETAYAGGKSGKECQGEGQN